MTKIRYDPRSISRIRKSENLIPILITMIYIGLLVVLQSKHEMWRDELQAWDISKSSKNLSELWKNMQYEANPGLWNFILFLITRLTSNLVLLRTINVASMATAVFLFSKYSNFPKLTKLLFAFGYFTVFEYGLINRHYSLTFLFAIAYAALISRKKIRYIETSIILVLLAFTNVHGMIISIAGMAFLIYKFLTSQKSGKSRKIILTSIIIFTVGILASLFIALPPEDYGKQTELRLEYNPAWKNIAISKVWDSHITIPENQHQFWNTNYSQSLRNKIIGAVLITAAILTYLLITNLGSAIFYITGTLLLLSVAYIKFWGVTRHDGHLFLITIIAFFIAFNDRKKYKNLLPKLLTRYAGGIIITVILITQVIGTVIATNYEIKYPFDEGVNVASFLQKEDILHYNLVGEKDTQASTVAMFLDKKFYYPRGDRDGTFIIFDNKKTPINSETFWKRVNNRFPTGHTLLIMSYPIEHPNTKLLKKFSESIAAGPYYLYLYK